MWAEEDLTSGTILRYADNADAILDVSQSFARVMLMRQLDNLEYDNGPRTMTRVVFRSRLLRMARGNDPARSAGAIRTLQLMKEAGTLLALSDERGTTGELALAALRELLSNPASLRRSP